MLRVLLQLQLAAGLPAAQPPLGGGCSGGATGFAAGLCFGAPLTDGGVLQRAFQELHRHCQHDTFELRWRQGYHRMVQSQTEFYGLEHG